MASLSNNHSLSAELNVVHKRMISKLRLREEMQQDIEQARKMEMYLRQFKLLSQRTQRRQHLSEYQGELDARAIRYIAQEVEKRMVPVKGRKSGALFYNIHNRYAYGNGNLAGADDVFEFELMSMLEVAASQAMSQIPQNLNTTGVSLMGNIPGNISKELMYTIQSQKQRLINAGFSASEVVNTPEARAGKVDVTGYHSSFVAEAQIRPEWQDFINTFTGVRATVKNYNGKAQTEIIHLGNTDTQKSIAGTLAYLGYSNKKATHIYFHALEAKSSEGVPHIQHLRFAYELTGVGLKDSQGNSLQEANFFIYNDPTSPNIYVRSTKEMIYNMMNYTTTLRSELTSNIVVLKQSFV